MIRLFILCLLALIIGVFLQLQFAEDPGYVLISYKGYDIEATLAAMVFALLIIYVVFSAFIWFVKTFNPLKLFQKKSWLVFSSKRKAILATEKGIQLLLLGHWQQAYKLLVENATKVDAPIFNYLAASIAALQHGDKVSWAFCLDRAEKCGAVSVHSVRSFKALMELKSGQFEQSLALLLALKKEVPASPMVLNSMKDVYIALTDWDKLWTLLPELEKNKTLKSEELFSLTEKASIYRIEQAASSNDPSELKKVWGSLPKQIKASDNAARSYIDQLIEKGNEPDAIQILTRFLKKSWSDKVVMSAGFIESKNPARLLSLLEGLAKNRPNNAALTLTLGRVCLRNQLWSKAREHFRNALLYSSDAELSAEIKAELGRLLEHLGEYEESLSHYSGAMALLERKIPELPMPELAISKLPALADI